MIRVVFAILACLLAAPALSQGFADRDPLVQGALIADRQSVAPGETFYLAFHQEIPEGWHTYWRNPGDSGEATVVDLALPEGFTTEAMIWPAPTPYPLGPLTNYGYSNAVALPIPVTVPADAEPGPITITAEATWLVCEQVCIPEEGAFSLSLAIGESVPDPEGAAVIQAALAAAPERLETVRSGLAMDGERLLLTVEGAPFDAGPEAISDVYFFPYDGDVIDHAADQAAVVTEAGVIVSLEPGFGIEDRVETVRAGVLAFEARLDGAWIRRAVAIEPQPEVSLLEAALPGAAEAGAGGAAARAAGSAQVDGANAFARAALFALIGGLILNLMPCVFPVLSMKALTIVKKRGATAGAARAQGLFFGAGVILTFLVLGGAVIGARAVFGGVETAWGFQLQVPVIVAGLAALVFLIGLNFLGVFEIGTSLQGVGGQISGEGRSGAFFTGVLAVFVAAPCVAPFMTGALTYALSQPVPAALAIFAFLGVGLALPFMLVSFFPALVAFLPKPGPWMERFKQFLAFPMFATAVWLIWVLSVQVGPAGVLWTLALFVALGFMIWGFKGRGLFGTAAGGAGLAAAAGALFVTAQLEPSQTTGAGGGFENWSPERVAELREEGRPVFVDFTAAWCVTCQFNKRTALADADVLEAFADNDVALLRADFTNRDPIIAETLAAYGAAGVPLYLLYPEGSGQAEILPALLTEAIVIRAVEAAVEGSSS